MKKNELPRFNMPYELGLDIGCAEFGSKKFKEKRILILETDRFHDLSQTLITDGFTESEIENMPNSDFISFAKDWIQRFTT